MIKTEYRGYEIHYSENADQWECRDCKIEGKSLQKVKAGIDKLHLKMRKDAAFECYEIDKKLVSYKVDLVDAKLIEFKGMKPARSWDTQSGKVPMVASMATRGGNSRPGRQERNLYDLAPVSLETIAAIEVANRLGAAARKAVEDFHKAIADIPRLKLEDIKDLIEASDHRFEEGAGPGD